MPTTTLEVPPKPPAQQETGAATRKERRDLQEITATDARCGMQTYGRQAVAFKRGAGARLWDVAGKQYLDFLGGIAVIPVGHCHPHVADAVAQQAHTLVHSSNLYYIEPQALLAEKLYGLSGGMRAFFCNSGAEANEAAIKLARKHSRKAHGEDRFEIITTIDSFHGRTIGSLAATGQPKYHEGFGPMPGGFRYVPINDIAALEAAIGPNTAAIMLEPIQGESGIKPCSSEYLQTARRLCDEHGLLLIFDEVQTGMGRTGKFFAHEWAEIEADIVTMAKGLGNGVPIGCMLATDTVAATFTPGNHGCTFGGNFLSCTAALATLEVVEGEGLMENALKVGEYFQQRLRAWSETTGALNEIRGQGLMVGVTLDQPVARELVKAALEEGLVINAVGDDILRFLPPLCIGREEVDEAVAKLDAAYKAVAS